MSPTQTPPHPATPGGVDIRTRPVASALPALAFVASAAHVPGRTHAAAVLRTPRSPTSFERVQQTVLHQTP